MLFLAHRLPYPPNKGDKVRSHYILCHPAARHRVYLGAFTGHPATSNIGRLCARRALKCVPLARFRYAPVCAACMAYCVRSR